MIQRVEEINARIKELNAEIAKLYAEREQYREEYEKAQPFHYHRKYLGGNDKTKKVSVFCYVNMDDKTIYTKPLYELDGKIRGNIMGKEYVKRTMQEYLDMGFRDVTEECNG